MDLPLFYQLPFWTNPLLLVGILFLSLECSNRVGIWQRRRSGEEREQDRRGDVILTALLALLGLMLAFTYSFTVSRSDMRKAAAIDEINAVGTAFLRADLLDEPHRTSIRTSLLEYARTLVIDPQIAATNGGISKIIERMSAKQSAMWPAVKEMKEAHGPSPLTNSMVQSITDVIDAHTKRLVAALDWLPEVILSMLLFVGCGCLSIVGYSAGRADSLRRWRTTVLTLVLAAVMTMITDFDRPFSGLVQMNQQPYSRQIHEMELTLEE
jgi:hypothetical protein